MFDTLRQDILDILGCVTDTLDCLSHTCQTHPYLVSHKAQAILIDKHCLFFDASVSVLVVGSLHPSSQASFMVSVLCSFHLD